MNSFLPFRLEVVFLRSFWNFVKDKYLTAKNNVHVKSYDIHAWQYLVYLSLFPSVLISMGWK